MTWGDACVITFFLGLYMVKWLVIDMFKPTESWISRILSVGACYGMFLAILHSWQSAH